MLDLKFLRENPEVVKQNIRNKFQDAKLPLVDEVIALDEENRKAKGDADALRANRNKVSQNVSQEWDLAAIFLLTKISQKRKRNRRKRNRLKNQSLIK